MIRCCFIYEDEGQLSCRLIKEIKESKSAQQANPTETKIHPEAIYTSRFLSFPEIEETLTS